MVLVPARDPVQEGRQGRAGIVAPPGEPELGRCQVHHGNDPDACGRARGGVALRHQRAAHSLGDQREHVVGSGGFGGDRRGRAGSIGISQPEVAQRPDDSGNAMNGRIAISSKVTAVLRAKGSSSGRATHRGSVDNTREGSPGSTGCHRTAASLVPVRSPAEQSDHGIIRSATLHSYPARQACIDRVKPRSMAVCRPMTNVRWPAPRAVSTASCQSSSTLRARSRRATPSGVSTKPSGRRSNSAKPNRRSRARSCLDTAGCEAYSRSAARATLSSSATATK